MLVQEQKDDLANKTMLQNQQEKLQLVCDL